MLSYFMHKDKENISFLHHGQAGTIYPGPALPNLFG